MHRFFRRPSPAMAVAFIALLAALSGTAVALPGRNTVDSGDLKRGAVKAGDIGRNAVTGPKIRNGSVGSADVRNDGLTGTDINESALGQVPSANTANSATTANSANTANTANSATVANRAGRALMADSGEDVLDWNATEQVVQTLSVPAGKWIINSKVLANNNTAGNPPIDCTLRAGGTTIDDGFDTARVGDANVDDREYFVYFGLADLAATTDVTLSCTGGTTGNWLNRRILAIEVATIG
jgi:hypothetical protein